MPEYPRSTLPPSDGLAARRSAIAALLLVLAGAFIFVRLRSASRSKPVSAESSEAGRITWLRVSAEPATQPEAIAAAPYVPTPGKLPGLKMQGVLGKRSSHGKATKEKPVSTKPATDSRGRISGSTIDILHSRMPSAVEITRDGRQSSPVAP